MNYQETKGSRHTPFLINGTEVEHVSSFKFLSVHISEALSWALNTSRLVKKVQQHLYFLRRLQNLHLSLILVKFSHGMTVSILTICIIVWNCRFSTAGRKVK